MGGKCYLVGSQYICRIDRGIWMGITLPKYLYLDGPWLDGRKE